MFGKIIIENGQKKIKPLTADVGAGLPVGTWCSFENDVAPNANWIRAGTTFDASAYPVLASYLGTNVVPNKGTGLDWDNAETITLSTSDYEVTKSGWITCYARPNSTSGATLYLRVNGVRVAYASYENYLLYLNAQVEVKAGDKVNFEGTANFQESHFVPYLHPLFIKATSGLSENQQDSVINALNVSRSYSTEETLTGKTWIDGKPIYRKVFMTTTLFSVGTSWVNTNFYLPNCDYLIEGKILRNNGIYPAVIGGTVNIDVANNYRIQLASFMSNSNCCGVIVEYTKTTD